MFCTYIEDPERRDKTPAEIRAYFNKYDPLTGQRYHDFGSMQEYEPNICGFPVSDLFEMRQNAKESNTK